MDLYIVRHAWAGHFGDPQWPDDGQRPLTEEGRQRFAQVVATLADRGFSPEMIATSPLVRCVQTAEIILDVLPGNAELVELDELAPGSDLASLMEWTAMQEGRCRQVAWVGHAPDVGRMTGALVGGAEGWVRLAKGGVAAIRFFGLPAIGDGELRWLVTAKMLGC